MSEEVRPAVVWSPEARDELRAIDRKVALDILHRLDRYLLNRAEDIKKLKPPASGFRLRCGDYRVFFDNPAAEVIHITGVKNRREAYR